MHNNGKHKPFAMIREFHLADWFTLANAACGTGALFSMLTYLQTTEVVHVYFAGGLVLAALIFDILDGRIARWRQKSSVLGRENRCIIVQITEKHAPCRFRPPSTCWLTAITGPAHI